jgi:hypothetical protein
MTIDLTRDEIPRDTYQNQLVPMVVEQTNRGERSALCQ